MDFHNIKIGDVIRNVSGELFRVKWKDPLGRLELEDVSHEIRIYIAAGKFELASDDESERFFVDLSKTKPRENRTSLPECDEETVKEKVSGYAVNFDVETRDSSCRTHPRIRAHFDITIHSLDRLMERTGIKGDPVYKTSCGHKIDKGVYRKLRYWIVFPSGAQRTNNELDLLFKRTYEASIVVRNGARQQGLNVHVRGCCIGYVLEGKMKSWDAGQNSAI